jgi:putative ABC transport system permease protein
MKLASRLKIAVSMLFGRGLAARKLDEELSFHMDRAIDEKVAAGMSAEEARYAALREFGNPALLRDQARATWNWQGPELLWRDVSYAARTLRRTPGFAAIAIAIIALGIGANVALFAVVRSVLLKPLPFEDSSRLMRLYEFSAFGDFPFNQNAGGIYAEWKKQNHSFSSIAISGYAGYNLSGEGEQLPENVRAGEFSWDFLPTLGVQPALGRNFTQDEDTPSGNPTVLLSWGLWKRRFGGDAGIIGRSILLNNKPYTVIWVMPSWFGYPQPEMQLWTPLYFNEPAKLTQAIDDHQFKVIGRLKPGMTPSEGLADLTTITRQVHDANLTDPFVSKAANIKPLLESMVGDLRQPLEVLLGATGCLLLIACLNVANLLVARSAARRKELAVRTALGGSGWRLLRQHLMESLLLSAVGGVAGSALAVAGLQWLTTTRHDMARAQSIDVDWVVAGFALGLIVLCAAFAGLVSAYYLNGKKTLGALQESSRGSTASQGRARLRNVLLTLEVGLTVVLLIGAGLLMKSYARLRGADLGCLTQNVMKMDLNLPVERYKQQTQTAQFFETLLERVRSLHGVKAAGYVFPVVPADGYGGDNGFTIVEHPALPLGKGFFAIHRWIDPGYFNAIGIPILRGHTLDDNQQPGHETEVVINNAFAHTYFPNEDPLGKHLLNPLLKPPPLEIVGVVGDTRTEMGEPMKPMMYFPLYASADMNGATLVVRSARDVTQFALPVQRNVEEMDRDLPVSDILTMDQVLGQNTLDASFNAELLAGFAVLSLLLSAAGLFGVLSYMVAQRTGEIGIRMALGAQREQVMGKMLGDGLKPAIVGLVLGLAGSVGAVRLLESMLYETDKLDPMVFAAVAGVLLAVAAGACMAPAWRASRVDPMSALRME